MRFDDFNYDAYNKHILVDDNHNQYDELTTQLLDGFVPEKSNTIAHAAIAERKRLTQKAMTNKFIEKFQHEELDVRTENEIAESEKELLEAKEEQARKVEQQT